MYGNNLHPKTQDSTFVIQIQKGRGMQEQHSETQSVTPQNQFNARPPVDLVVFARDLLNTKADQELKYTTLPSPYTSLESFRSHEPSSNRADNLLSRTTRNQFQRSTTDSLDGTARRDIFGHSPLKTSENLKHAQFHRSNFDNRHPRSIARSHFKPIHPALSNSINLPSREIFGDYTSDLNGEPKNAKNSTVQYNSDPYLTKPSERQLYNNLDSSSPRNTNFENSNIKRVRLAIPQTNGNHVPASPKKSLYEESEDGSLLQVSINEEGEIDIRNRYSGVLRNHEMSPRRRPSGFGGRLLPQVPESSILDQVETGSNCLQPPPQNGNKHDGPNGSAEEDSFNENFPQIDGRRMSSYTNSGVSNPTYLKRRRTAVFGLSPTSGLNIGAVM